MPPCMFKTNLETGASGTTSKVVRMPPWIGVDAAAEDDVDRPVRGLRPRPGRAGGWRRSAGRPGLPAGRPAAGVVALALP